MRHKHPHSKGPRKPDRPSSGPRKQDRSASGSGSRKSERSPSNRKPERFASEKPAPKSREQSFTHKPGKPKDNGSAHPRLTGPLLWGFHAVRAAWQNKDRRILRLLVTDAGLSGFQDTLDKTSIKRPAPEMVEKILFDRLLPAGAVHQGIVAMVEPLPGRDAHDLIASLGADEKAIIVILDQVTDPHNVGAILRSAAAFGARGVILQERHTPEFTGVLAKTASGAADVIPIALETNLSRAIEMLQENGFFVVGLDERGDSIATIPAHDRVALVLGAEGSGLRQNVAHHCDTLASLPTEGPILSLNVSNAAAVALYALKVK